MVPQVIEETILKGQRKVLGIIIEDRKTKIDSPLTGDLTMVCFPVCQKSPKEILATEKAARSFEPPPKMLVSDREICPRQLSHLVKGIKKERTKSSDTPRGESKRINDRDALSSQEKTITANGRMILASIEKGPLVWPSITVDGVTRLKEYTELTPAEAIQADCDIKAINIILQGLPTKIYALVSQHRVAKDLWEKIKLLMQGTSLTKQERECKLYDEIEVIPLTRKESDYTSTT
ncbi:hypothetical protein Tco_1384476 [Tanacetum coccineum]